MLLVSAAALAVLLLVWYFSGGTYPPLSAEERLLVGEWSGDSSEFKRIFKSDRTFVTSPLMFTGVWHINQGELKVTYREGSQFPRSLSSVSQSWGSFQRSFSKENYKSRIQFSDNGNQHTLNHPVDKQHPDGKTLWTRKTDR